VIVPLLYGISWLTGSRFDHDGSLTRWVAHLPVEGLEPKPGIGVGHQDFVLETETGETSLVGHGSVGEIMVALEIGDPRFELKCRSRGLDPDDVRRQMGN